MHEEDPFVTAAQYELEAESIPDTAGPSASAAPNETSSHLHTRDRLLGSALLVFAAGSGLLVIANILTLVDALDASALTGLIIADGFVLLGTPIGIAGFAAIAAGFLGGAPTRATRIAVGFWLLASGFGLTFAGGIVTTVVYGAHQAKGTFVAGNAADAVFSLFLTLAAVLSAMAFARRPASPGSSAIPRDYRLGRAAVSVTVALLFEMISSILLLVALSDAGATSGFTAGVGLTAAGAGVAIAAGALAAVGLFNSSADQRRAITGWLRKRDGNLATGSAILTLAFLLMLVGSILTASSASANGFDGKTVAADWLTFGQSMAATGAAATACVGFFISRRRTRTEHRTEPQTRRRHLPGPGSLPPDAIQAQHWGRSRNNTM
jgi:hypothetical protein